MWEFRKDAQRKWYWKEVDDMGRLLRRSAQYFRERIDCVAHAMRNGYVHPRQRALATRRAQGHDANRTRERRQT
jgi:hypothetical protein